MPYRYQIHPDPGLLVMRYVGHTTMQDQRDLVTDVTSDPDWRFGLPMFLDSSQMTGTDITVLSLISLRDRFRPLFTQVDQPVLWAQYAPNDLAFGMSRMTQEIMDEIPTVNMEVFTDLSSAVTFLGVEGEVHGLLESIGIAASDLSHGHAPVTLRRL
ncbi:hypothetical protein CLV78_103170 [Aliiruegeria haliotis]|uniref:Uncharacterized protein n=1 Tax=Aliiruegeria haliotis TaxID=1280846 RepID=A0A2T0RSZ5_9RHOB|nr:hypothetical protein [Aliiruegeria haliotis]PRY24304.1 hypothetical protein CLV78_103170 [Aliiruegeria haliotis]